jgi:hypothetical protein
VAAGLWELAAGLSESTGGLWKVPDGLWELAAGLWELPARLWELPAGRLAWLAWLGPRARVASYWKAFKKHLKTWPRRRFLMPSGSNVGGGYFTGGSSTKQGSKAQTMGFRVLLVLRESTRVDMPAGAAAPERGWGGCCHPTSIP